MIKAFGARTHGASVLESASWVHRANVSLFLECGFVHGLVCVTACVDASVQYYAAHRAVHATGHRAVHGGTHDGFPLAQSEM